MPLTSIVCPHCERSVEVQTTSVTRSRECPNCGKNIILELTSHDGKNRRRALFTAPKQDSDAGKKITGALTGRIDSGASVAGPRDRQINEPEVQSRIKHLKWGLMVICGMIVFVVGNSFQWWSGPAREIAQAGRPVRGSSVWDTIDEPPPELPPRSEIKVEPQPPVAESTHVTAPEQPASLQLTDLETAKNVVASFLTAKSVDERVGMVRDRSINEKRMRRYYASHGDGPVAYERIEARDVNLHGVFTCTFNVLLKDGTRREVLVGKAKSGTYVVDWASFVLYSEMDWGEFRSKHPRTGVMFRLLVTPADHYTGEFSDSQELFCLKLIHPAEPESPPLYGYVKKSEALGRVLQGMTDKSHAQAQPLMLKIAFPEKGEPGNQVLITEFIGEGWIARNW